MSSVFRRLFPALLVVAATLSIGCAHTVQINSEPPGAEVFVDGKSIGKTPVTWQETTGEQKPVDIVVKQGGQEKVVTVQRNQPAWEPIGIGAGAGVGACLAIGCVGGGALSFVSSVFPPACLLGIPLGVVQLAALAGGPAGAWWFYGNKSPDSVSVDFKENKVQTVPAGLAAFKDPKAANDDESEPAPEPIGY